MGGYGNSDEKHNTDEFLHWTNATINKCNAVLLPCREVSLQPLRQTVQSGEKHALGNVGLIELVADLPLERSGDDDAAMHGLAPVEQLLEREFRARRQGEERELIDNAFVERRRLEEDDEVVAEALEFFERG